MAPLLDRLPPRWRTTVDWVATILGAVVVADREGVRRQPVPDPVLVDGADTALRAPGARCEASSSDRVLANRFIFHFRDPRRGEVVVFDAPPGNAVRLREPRQRFVKRLIGCPATRSMRTGRAISPSQRSPAERAVRVGRRARPGHLVPQPLVAAAGRVSKDGATTAACRVTRAWGPGAALRPDRPVFATYWPPNRVSHGLVGVARSRSRLVAAGRLRRPVPARRAALRDTGDVAVGSADLRGRPTILRPVSGPRAHEPEVAARR
jgi:signal peptidase I